KPRTASDSDIRIEQLGQLPSATQSGTRRRDQEGHITEEIDLDAEARKAEETAKTARPRGRSQAKQPNLPPASPFELSESGIGKTPAPRAKEPAKTDPEEDSSDFELKPLGTDEISPLELGSDEVAKMPSDDEVELGAQKQAAHDSGINLQ